MPSQAVIKPLTLTLPHWLRRWLPAHEGQLYASAAARMDLAIELAALNVAHRSGGPFGAAIFDRRDGRLLAGGVNLVVAGGASHWHGEMVAIARAQQLLGSHDLRSAGDFELVTSVEPCLMCLGATIASGVRALTCGARSDDAEAIGFDEGPKPLQWPLELRRRGIAVRRDLRRRAAQHVLQDYAASGGEIYLGG